MKICLKYEQFFENMPVVDFKLLIAIEKYVT